MTAEILSKLQINNYYLTRTATHSVGDVQHIFSHIKKTYRTRWIVLESNNGPPPPVFFDYAEKSSSRKQKSKKAAPSLDDKRTNTKWVSLKEVSDMKFVAFFLVFSLLSSQSITDYSMGTGVSKIWNLTKKLWE